MFAEFKQRSDQQFTCHISYLEIYNEQVCTCASCFGPFLAVLVEASFAVSFKKKIYFYYSYVVCIERYSRVVI